MQIRIKEALANLNNVKDTFFELFSNHSISVELYKPINEDQQKPHERDEVYIIASGSGNFYLEEIKYEFEANDFFFVPTGKVYRFEEFTNDFLTWVIFLNPDNDKGKAN